MAFEVIGTLHKKFETENKTNTFQAREFVLEVKDGNYPQMVKFQLTQDRCSLIDSANEGDQLKVHFDLRGREWNGKYFTNLNAWRIEAATSAGNAEAETAPPPAGNFPSVENEPPQFDGQDDLPF